MRKSFAWAVVVLFVVTGLYGCGSGGSSDSTPSNNNTNPLIGTWYAATADGSAVTKSNHNYMIYSASTYSTLWGVTSADCLDYGTYSYTSSGITCTPVHSDCSSGSTAYTMPYTLSGNNLTISGNGHSVVYVKQ